MPAVMWAVLGIGLVTLAFAAALGEASQQPPRSYGAASTVAGLADVAAGTVVIGAAILAAVLAVNRVSVLLVLLAVTWLAPDMVGWIAGPPLLRSIALVMVPFAVPAVLHLALARSDGRLRSATSRGIVALSLAGAVLYGVVRALFRDPFLDLHCWNNCEDNVFLVRPSLDLVALIDRGWLMGTTALTALASGVLIVRFARASRVGRRAVLWPTWAAIAVLASFGASAVLLLLDPAEDPRRLGFALAFLARAVGIAALAAGVSHPLLTAHRRRAEVVSMAEQLQESPRRDSLEKLLRRSLRDPELMVGYRVQDQADWVDAAGAPLALRPGPTQATTTVVRDGRELAVIVHDAQLPDAAGMPGRMGPALTLAVDNERLQAEMAARITELRASRGRIVAAANAARRAAERDLHDGAQQRLLAVAFELRVAISCASGDARSVDALEDAVDVVQRAMGRLRKVAHGLFPAVLAEGRLEDALERLASDALVPMTVEVAADARDLAARTTVYSLLERVVRWASAHDATHVGVQVTEVDAHGVTSAGVAVPEVEPALHLRVDLNGLLMDPDELIHLRDRAEAQGGRILTEGPYLRAVIPCV